MHAPTEQIVENRLVYYIRLHIESTLDLKIFLRTVKLPTGYPGAITEAKPKMMALVLHIIETD